jgi:flagellar P-ring protein precursor FlgI
MPLRRLHALVLLAVLVLVPRLAMADKLRDLADVSGARDNQLVGYGIVGGLSGTGDDLTVPFASQSILSLLRRLGVQIDPSQMQQMMLRNLAAVVVTATLPPFARAGTKIDVTVASIGNARSLLGGVLVQTVLKGPDQHPYAVAQGSLLVGGFDVRGRSGSSMRSGSVNAGRIAEGGIVERDVPTVMVTDGKMSLELRSPAFTVAARIAEAINTKLGNGAAHADDGGRVSVTVPQEYQNRLVDLVAALEDLEIAPVRRARVIINERTGTLVAGGDVRLAPAAVVHGNLTIVVRETRGQAAPPVPFVPGRAVLPAQSHISAEDESREMHFLPAAASLSDVASALGTLGLPPRELGSVLEALRSAGALEAEVIIQ